MEDRLMECDSVCEKCGSDDKHVTYREVGEWLKHYNKYNPAYADAYKVTKEHLHHHCRKCGYSWDTEPINTRATDHLMEEMARALEAMMDDIEIDYDNDIPEAVLLAEQALQKYREATCQVEKR